MTDVGNGWPAAGQAPSLRIVFAPAHLPVQLDNPLEMGFGNLSYFDRTFRRRFGASPSDVRQGSRG
jgi:hypothetical protein